MRQIADNPNIKDAQDRAQVNIIEPSEVEDLAWIMGVTPEKVRQAEQPVQSIRLGRPAPIKARREALDRLTFGGRDVGTINAYLIARINQRIR